MWSVSEEKKAEKQIDRAPREIVFSYEFWKNIVIVDGPKGLKKFSGFRDHPLKGEWLGARSSYLNKKWRVIYVVEHSELSILVLEVNPHDYRKKT